MPIAPPVGKLSLEAPDAAAAHLGRRVHVRDEADHRHARPGRCRGNGREHVTVFVHDHVVQANVLQLPYEQSEQIVLLRGAWIGRAGLDGLRVDDDISK